MSRAGASPEVTLRNLAYLGPMVHGGGGGIEAVSVSCLLTVTCCLSDVLYCTADRVTLTGAELITGMHLQNVFPCTQNTCVWLTRHEILHYVTPLYQME
jgi:hypothetical protein